LLFFCQAHSFVYENLARKVFDLIYAAFTPGHPLISGNFLPAKSKGGTGHKVKKFLEPCPAFGGICDLEFFYLINALHSFLILLAMPQPY
jgi:hypothetical protein